MSDPFNNPLFSALAGGAFDSADLAKRVAELERRVEQLEARTAPDPRIGRRCRVIAEGSAGFTGTVEDVERSGMLLVRDPRWPIDYVPHRVHPSSVEWLIEPILESR